MPRCTVRRLGIWLIATAARDVCAAALFTVQVWTYCDSSGPRNPPLSWDANLTLRTNRDTVHGGQACLALRFHIVRVCV